MDGWSFSKFLKSFDRFCFKYDYEKVFFNYSQDKTFILIED